MLTLLSGSIYGQNRMISNQNLPNEPSIAMDPNNPNRLIAGSNIDNYYVSNDSGDTWSEHTLSSSYGVWGDPVIIVDTAGDFYFFHLSNPPSPGNWVDRIVCQKTTDAGATWSDGSFAGLNGTKVQDKHWVVVDRTNNNIYVTWTQFDVYDSTNPNDSTVILFSKSTDAGSSWSTPIRISAQGGSCIDSDNAVEGAVPAVGPSGEIYVVWAGPEGLVFNKSLDQGNTWLPHEQLITTIPSGWNYTIAGINRTNGLPFISCDLSNGPNQGTIYVNWSDQRNGPTDTDVWLAKSTDAGLTWSNPIRVNDDGVGKQQFFTSMALDQTTGYLYFTFYDRRNHPTPGDTTDVYLAVSIDGGQSFLNRKISEQPFKPTGNIFFGDYTGIVAHAGIIRPIWTRLHNSQLSIWTHLITADDLFTLGLEEPIALQNLDFENFPNPSTNYTDVSFKLHTVSIINLSVIDANGKVVRSVIKDEKYGIGKYVKHIDFDELGLSNGDYLLKLTVDGVDKIVRQVKL